MRMVALPLHLQVKVGGNHEVRNEFMHICSQASCCVGAHSPVLWQPLHAQDSWIVRPL